MDRGLLAAVRRFPLKGQEIMRLALSDMSFRSLCEDLADAEHARDTWAASSSSVRAARLGEYQTLVNELADEIEMLLAS
ncbi:MAG: hypothetical protein KDJ86_01490 [Bauldia sp.]|uniref:hypothetical protein n=1 Tax=Bauldia sp. TaxID=2575872 RepID=UPI001D5161FF|nr:hypothetical protein [Bauldia sp.]MCB1494431.1 hypothetical protein [Bauldia sp.]